MSIKAVLFDLDGTLVNSLEDLAAATNHAISSFGYAEKPVENYNKYVGSGVYKMIERALQPRTVSDTMLKRMRDVFFEYYSQHYLDNTTAYGGMVQLIADLKCRGIKVGCITNKVDKVAKDIIANVFGSFDVVFGQIDSVPVKPNPTLVNKALEILKVKPEECLFVGDSDVDIKTALNSCTVPVGVSWGFRGEEELQSAGAKHIVYSAKEILNLV